MPQTLLQALALSLTTALLLSSTQAYAECARVENLVEREKLLQYHLDRGTQLGQLSPSQSDRIQKKLQKLDKEICYLRDRHCITVADEHWLNEQLTGVSVQLFRALRKGEVKLAERL